MSYFKAKMHQIQFRLGLRPNPQLNLREPTSKGRRREGEKGREGVSGEGRGRHSLARPLALSTQRHCCSIRPNLVYIRPLSAYSLVRFTKYLTTTLRLSYDNAKVTIDSRRPAFRRTLVLLCCRHTGRAVIS